MNKKISMGAAVTLAIMFSTATFIITMICSVRAFDNKVFNIKERETMYAKLAEVDRIVRQNYLNTVDEAQLGDMLIGGYVKGISDRYGMYLTAEQYTQITQDFDGKMVDIGLTCVQDADGYIKIQEVYPESPAAAAELEKGDLIVKVDELSVTAENYAAAVEALKGDPGTKVSLKVRRGGAEKKYEITRRKVEVPTAVYKIIENVGYLRIKEFNDNTPAQFNRCIDALLEAKVSGIVFDVRNNPGGTINSVSQILDRLLPEGDIVSATYRDGRTEVLAVSDANSIDLPMAVLINDKSASAAELFAQALKDYEKAKTVGVTSFGKGSMQTIYKLSDGSALDITVALYNPPKSANFEGVGVKPDYEVKLTPDQEKNFVDLDVSSDPQLKKAMELMGATIKNQMPSVEPPRNFGSSSSTSVESEFSQTID